jgi:integrase
VSGLVAFGAEQGANDVTSKREKTGKRNKLTDAGIKALAKRGERGRHSDGGSLYFHVNEGGSCAWEYTFRFLGRRPTMGLGSYPGVSLAGARVLRDDAERLVRKGVNPIIDRKATRQTAATAVTVMQALKAHVEVKKSDWKTERYPGQILSRLDTYVKGRIGHLPIADIGRAEILQVLQPIWTSRRPTANRIRMHLEGAINWAIQKGVRENESNPAEIGRLDHTLSFAKREVVHYPALSYRELPGFLLELRKQQDTKARALEFVILTGVRVGDVCGGGKKHSEPLKWSHVDLPGRTWTVPDTKMGRPLTVPLSDSALALLAVQQQFRDPLSDIVFPGSKRGTVISSSTLLMLLYAMGYKGRATTHGMRSCLRTWAAEETLFEKDVYEAALAHAKKTLDKAYHRAEFLDKRRQMMIAWTDYLEGRDQHGTGDNVVSMRA